MIELLVVISIIALLMAILLPTLGRVRKQARAVTCRSNLRQWGTIFTTDMAEHNGSYPWWADDAKLYWLEHIGHSLHYNGSPSVPRLSPQWSPDYQGILICPMASIPADGTGPEFVMGGTFRAWQLEDSPVRAFGSYGWNAPLGVNKESLDPSVGGKMWRPQDIKSPANIPVLMDSAWMWGFLSDLEPPPPSDAIPTMTLPPPGRLLPVFCMNRHDGCINGLFLDWSVRKVGLKELWTLKWDRIYNTGGPWTKAGGVRPEDWPEWMRKFKDY